MILEMLIVALFYLDRLLLKNQYNQNRALQMLTYSARYDPWSEYLSYMKD